ncbi:hypothetical protein [uncultured Algibacter sp.]|uniref:hypothetical protein n=1 Tax=uncultured Algibacter sp. TaxID=298659 RepID=UPI00260D5C04|nr:hypothetical protein [uncultured Algibacter sp.]
MPIHKEVKSTLHNISHYIQKPSVVLSHNKYENKKINIKKSTFSNHDHKIIDLLDYFIGLDNKNNNSNKPSLVDVKIDKHYYSPKYNLVRIIINESPFVFNNYNEELKDGFNRKIKVPPKAILMQHL